MVTAVSKSDYDQAIRGKLREKLGAHHYTFAIQSCLAQIEEWLRESTFSGQAIGYVFDWMGKGKNEINDLFDDLIANKLAVAFGIQSNGWTFGNRRSIVQLQASDILAWEGNKFARDHHFQKLSPRASFTSMARTVGIRHRFFYGDNLREFARDMESRYEKCGWNAPSRGFFPAVR